MRRGDFSESFPGAPARTIYDPDTTTVNPATGQQQRTAFANNQIPTNRLDPIALQLLNLYPLPTFTDRLSGNFLANPVKEFKQHYINGRVDHNFSNSDTLFGRFTWDRATQFYPYGFPYGRAGTYSTVDYLTRARNLAISETHIFSPRLLNQATFGYNFVQQRHDVDRPGTEPAGAVRHSGRQRGRLRELGPDADQPRARLHQPRRPRVHAVRRRHRRCSTSPTR